MKGVTARAVVIEQMQRVFVARTLALADERSDPSSTRLCRAEISTAIGPNHARQFELARSPGSTTRR